MKNDLKKRFLIANGIAIVYAAGSLYLAQWWIHDLARVTGHCFFGFSIVLFIAIVPGYLNILLLVTLLLYKYEPVRMKGSDLPPVTVLIAAYNEEDAVHETLRGLKHQNYPNALDVLVVSDGSTDRTVKRFNDSHFPNLRVIDARHGGKSHALNLGLVESRTEIIVTMDADTFLHRKALRRIVMRLLSRDDYAAVAGDVLVKNERLSRLTRMQIWDYMLGIASVKRQQSMFNSTLVAQGAFSAFRKKALLDISGWEDRIGEDIVLTWGLLKKGWHVGYEPTAFAFTNAPIKLQHFLRQRERWARGMIEGFKAHIDILWTRNDFGTFFVALDLFFPFIDFFYTFVFIPGLILACFGYFYIVGLFTLFVLPINIVVTMIMMQTQKRFLRYAGLKLRENPIGLVVYLLVYQVIVSPICVKGYCGEFLNRKRIWK
jgi:biofilm PGA synthesis N-glycosyltransferase PgaC